jgi:hypothetical protein
MIFGDPNKFRYFNELEINGQPTRDEDDEEYIGTPQDDNTEDEFTDETPTEETPEDNDLEDFTEDEFVDDTEDNEAADEETSEEGTEDEVVEEEPAKDEEVDETPTEETPEDNDLEDFTEDEFVDDTGEETSEEDVAGDNEDGDETTDYTQMTDDSGSDDENIKDDSAEENKGEGDNADGDNPSNIGNKLSDMEKNLFADLTPQQLAIKNNELLQNYITLYDTIGEIFDNINKIPKTYTNTRPLTFIADQLVELKDMVNYIITTTYITRTYVENMTYYKQSLVILTQLNTMLKELVEKGSKK